MTISSKVLFYTIYMQNSNHFFDVLAYQSSVRGGLEISLFTSLACSKTDASEEICTTYENAEFVMKAMKVILPVELFTIRFLHTTDGISELLREANCVSAEFSSRVEVLVDVIVAKSKIESMILNLVVEMEFAVVEIGEGTAISGPFCNCLQLQLSECSRDRETMNKSLHLNAHLVLPGLTQVEDFGSANDVISAASRVLSS